MEEPAAPAPVQLPEWQNAFALASNVRFSRTPESELQKRRTPMDPPKDTYAARRAAEKAAEAERTAAAEKAAVDALLANRARMAANQPLADLAPGVDATGGEPVQPVVTPAMLQDIALTGMRAPFFAPIDIEAREPAEPDEAAPETPVAAPPLPSPQTAAVAAQPAGEGQSPALPDWVSDFAFFETLGQGADFGAIAPRPAVPDFSTSAPAGSVVALYREVPPKSGSIREDDPVQEAREGWTRLPATTLTPTLFWTATVVRAGFGTETMPEADMTATEPLIEAVAEPAAEAPVEDAGVIEAPAPVEAPAMPSPLPSPVSATVPAPASFSAAVQRPLNRLVEDYGPYEFPPVSLLQEPSGQRAEAMSPEALEQSAGLLESILEDFGVKGEIIDVRPGPVVTLYEFEPAPGVKSSRVIGLSDDIARSMSALSARVAVVPGRNVIGVELPNAVRETVFFRELIECEEYWESKYKLAVCLGKTIGGEPVIAELAKMPHLLVAGTTGSGKSVAINTMILSLVYRLRPEECRLIMVDPKMLELSVYDGIPHLLTPVVTDPKKAVMALKWAVREMEDRYRKMSRLGVRNIDGYNARAAEARAKGEEVTVQVPSGFDRSTGEPTYTEEAMDLSHMPYIVVIVDEMADLMMVAGKEIEGAIQRLAQMARAAGIHLIMATQRPSVDVITGTIKANFPTRISFQVTSKIDSRTILGEQGAEHLLGQGDMLHMAGGGRISRVHGPFVSDREVEHVVAHLKRQGRPHYLGTVTEEEAVEDAQAADEAVFDKGAMAEESGDDLFEKAVKVVLRDRKCSTSYIQRRLSIGYNRAASLVERMEQEGLVGPANHVGKREIISGSRDAAPAPMDEDE
ncbi:FtsK/SpoIIIE domain-containing protein [Rhizobiaceae bacterium BDR2-2]|uniref:FtsK/SpoIIIE domain-containing protein n=1 Tax=Ectorhizobium quercum TaxID=2965071 RepID=A0AAE3MZL8_9HYPH|nr:DNA translocase FtsK [Ectorhizobium quercum]MCX8998253.1 FtsK/SpoIIIE domain-containing protein [Ectorhizobium quercum]